MTQAPLSEAQRGVLLELPTRHPPSRIDRIWLFPPRLLGEKESGLVVLSLFPQDEPSQAQRLVVTLRFEAERTRGRLQRTDTWIEQGSAPTERIPRVIAGVLSRLGSPEEEPRTDRIGGDEERWTAFLEALGIEPLDPPNGE